MHKPHGAHGPDVLIAPSLLGAEPLVLQQAIASAASAGADALHIDVMDGLFAPNFGFSPRIVKSIQNQTSLPLDVHLMVSQPHRWLAPFIEAGAKAVTVHVEAFDSVALAQKTLRACRDQGAKAGISISPDTPTKVIEPVLNAIDLVLVMSVNPGFGGQSFLPNTYAKVARLHQLRCASLMRFAIAVDGGVDDTVATRLVNEGADILIAGAYMFGAPDLKKAMHKLVVAAQCGRRDQTFGRGVLLTT